MKKVCSSNTIEGLQKLINTYFYSDNYTIDIDTLLLKHPFKKTNGQIQFKKGKYTYYL